MSTLFIFVVCHHHQVLYRRRPPSTIMMMMYGTALVVFATACVTQTLAAGVAHTQVVDLNPTNFETELNDPNNPLWLLKFYAPWCGHCKHMAPILDRVAEQMAGKMAIGKIDCTIHKSLCDKYQISGYPTLKYSVDGVQSIVDYTGARSETELIKFARKMSAPAVTLVHSYDNAIAKVRITGDDEEATTTTSSSSSSSDASSSSSLQQQHGVIFVAYDPKIQIIGLYKNRPMPAVEDFLRTTDMTIAFEKVARQEQAHANFAILGPASDCCQSFVTAERMSTTTTTTNADSPTVVDPDVHPFPFVARLEENVPPRIWQPPASTADYVTSLHAFVTDHYFPVVSAVGPDNFHKLGRHGRPLVLGVVQGSNATQIEEMKQQLSVFGVHGPEDLVSQYYLGWIDGRLWQRFLEQFEVQTEDLPLVFVLDVPKKRYWQNVSYQKEHGIQAFLEAIRDGKITSKVSSGPPGSIKGFWGVVKFLETTFLENLPWSVVILISFCAAFAILVVPAPEELRPPYKPKRPEGQQQQHQQQPGSGATTDEATATSDAAEEPKKEK